MKKTIHKPNARSGFTIVELVIVIAVISVLAAVIIPTFSGIIKRAKESQALQNVKNEQKEQIIDSVLDNDPSPSPENGDVLAYYIHSNGDSLYGNAVVILFKDGRALFTPSPLSSNIFFGTYEILDNKLMLSDELSGEGYAFSYSNSFPSEQISFIANESSLVPMIRLDDGAAFQHSDREQYFPPRS